MFYLEFEEGAGEKEKEIVTRKRECSLFQRWKETKYTSQEGRYGQHVHPGIHMKIETAHGPREHMHNPTLF